MSKAENPEIHPVELASQREEALLTPESGSDKEEKFDSLNSSSYEKAGNKTLGYDHEAEFGQAKLNDFLTRDDENENQYDWESEEFKNIPEIVRNTVSFEDDPTLPVITFRSVVLSALFCTIGSIVSQIS